MQNVIIMVCSLIFFYLTHKLQDMWKSTENNMFQFHAKLVSNNFHSDNTHLASYTSVQLQVGKETHVDLHVKVSITVQDSCLLGCYAMPTNQYLPLSSGSNNPRRKSPRKQLF